LRYCTVKLAVGKNWVDAEFTVAFIRRRDNSGNLLSKRPTMLNTFAVAGFAEERSARAGKLTLL
jgi:hypothetical protein